MLTGIRAAGVRSFPQWPDPAGVREVVVDDQHRHRLDRQDLAVVGAVVSLQVPSLADVSVLHTTRGAVVYAIGAVVLVALLVAVCVVWIRDRRR